VNQTKWIHKSDLGFTGCNVIAEKPSLHAIFPLYNQNSKYLKKKTYNDTATHKGEKNTKPLKKKHKTLNIISQLHTN